MLLQTPETNKMYSAYSSESSTTPFGIALWEIIRFPHIPAKVSSLYNNIPNRKTRNSKLTQEQYDVVRDKWLEQIEESCQVSSPGLSLREFMMMIAELFGVDPDPSKESDWPASMSSVHRLITTADPTFKYFAVNLNRFTLEFVHQFSSVSLDHLVKLGEETVSSFKQKRDQEALIQSSPLDATLINAKKPVIYLDRDATPVDSGKQANSLRTIVHQYLIDNGYRDLVEQGVKPEELLELMYESTPLVSLTTLRFLLKHIDVDPMLFLELILSDV